MGRAQGVDLLAPGAGGGGGSRRPADASAAPRLVRRARALLDRVREPGVGGRQPRAAAGVRGGGRAAGGDRGHVRGVRVGRRRPLRRGPHAAARRRRSTEPRSTVCTRWPPRLRGPGRRVARLGPRVLLLRSARAARSAGAIGGAGAAGGARGAGDPRHAGARLPGRRGARRRVRGAAGQRGQRARSTSPRASRSRCASSSS